MLYDPKWTTRTDPHSMESLIEWLEKKPVNGVYWVTNAKTCLLGEYYKDMGFRDYGVRSANTSFISKFGKVAIAWNGPWPASTYGAALERARKIAITSSPVP